MMRNIVWILSLIGATLASDLCMDMEDGVMLVNPSDCNMFLTCLGGHAFEMLCQEGLNFNQDTQQCDYPHLVNCNPSGPPPVVPPVQPGSLEKHIDERCKSNDPLNTLLLAHETDCDKYYICEGEWAITMLCPTGTEWNEEAKMCDFPHISNCNKVKPKPIA